MKSPKAQLMDCETKRFMRSPIKKPIDSTLRTLVLCWQLISNVWERYHIPGPVQARGPSILDSFKSGAISLKERGICSIRPRVPPLLRSRPDPDGEGRTLPQSTALPTRTMPYFNEPTWIYLSFRTCTTSSSRSTARITRVVLT